MALFYLFASNAADWTSVVEVVTLPAGPPMPDDPHCSDTAHSERVLIERALTNDRRAVAELVRWMIPTIRARAASVLARCARRRDLAAALDDIVQQVMIVLFQNEARVLRTWDPQRGLALRSFIGLIAERQAIGIVRSGRANPFFEDPTERELLEEHARTSNDPEGDLSSRELAEAIAERLRATLTPYAMSMFQLLFIEEAEVGHVAEKLAMSEAAVYGWRSRLIRQVRSEMRALLAESETSQVSPENKS